MNLRDLESLVKKLEQATEGSRELDALIYVGMIPGHHWKHGGNLAATARQMQGYDFIPRYTTSLDAAVTLIPKGWRVLNLSEWDAEVLRLRGPWMCQLRKREHRINIFEGFDAGAESRHAMTPALALCIASLRALQSGENNDGK